MTTGSAAHGRYTHARVLRYLQSVEAAYDVSLKFWVNARKDAGASPDIHLFCWGSGAAFELIPEGIPPRAITVYDDEEDSLPEALYWSISSVERLLNRVREPIGTRPVL